MIVRVQVPASTTNFGPGFDCLGAALQLSNRITLEQAADSAHPPMAAETARLYFTRAGVAPFGFRLEINGDVPPARGLGSSVTIRAGVLLALNAICGEPLAAAELQQLCTELEGHPDNAAAALQGGFVIVNQARRRVARFEVDPALRVVLLVPDFEVKTNAARLVLPESYVRSAVVENLANVALITAAFASGNYALLNDVFYDHMHQPFRESLVPFLHTTIRAAQNAGALGGFLSGSGSTIACLTLQNADGVAKAMLQAAPEANGTILNTAIDNRGARIL